MILKYVVDILLSSWERSFLLYPKGWSHETGSLWALSFLDSDIARKYSASPLAAPGRIHSVLYMEFCFNRIYLQVLLWIGFSWTPTKHKIQLQRIAIYCVYKTDRFVKRRVKNLRFSLSELGGVTLYWGRCASIILILILGTT